MPNRDFKDEAQEQIKKSMHFIANLIVEVKNDPNLDPGADYIFFKLPYTVAGVFGAKDNLTNEQKKQFLTMLFPEEEIHIHLIGENTERQKHQERLEEADFVATELLQGFRRGVASTQNDEGNYQAKPERMDRLIAFMEQVYSGHSTAPKDLFSKLLVDDQFGTLTGAKRSDTDEQIREKFIILVAGVLKRATERENPEEAWKIDYPEFYNGNLIYACKILHKFFAASVDKVEKAIAAQKESPLGGEVGKPNDSGSNEPAP